MKHLLASVLTFRQQPAQNGSRSVLEGWQTGLLWPGCGFFKAFSLPDRTTKSPCIILAGYLSLADGQDAVGVRTASLGHNSFLSSSLLPGVTFRTCWVLKILGKILISSQCDKLLREMGGNLPDLANILPKLMGF